MNQDTQRKLRPLEEASDLLGISHWTLRKYIPSAGKKAAHGQIKAVRIGTKIFIGIEEIDRIAKEGLPRLNPGKNTPVGATA